LNFNDISQPVDDIAAAAAVSVGHRSRCYTNTNGKLLDGHRSFVYPNNQQQQQQQMVNGVATDQLLLNHQQWTMSPPSQSFAYTSSAAVLNAVKGLVFLHTLVFKSFFHLLITLVFLLFLEIAHSTLLDFICEMLANPNSVSSLHCFIM
jgi:hypothetical protein